MGFTLVEMMVVMTIFGVTLTAVSDIFVRAQRSARKTSAYEKLQQDMRFIMNRITSDVRNGSIDYSFYVGANAIDSVNGNDALAVINSEGKHLVYKASITEDDCGALSTPCMMITEVNNGITARERLSSDGVRVKQKEGGDTIARFYITPSVNPFVPDGNGTYLSNQQPRVTTVISATSKIKSVADPAAISLQSTATTREYRR